MIICTQAARNMINHLLYVGIIRIIRGGGEGCEGEGVKRKSMHNQRFSSSS